MNNIVADLAQTFFIDPAAVKGASHTFISSIELYFRNKPVPGTSSSNLPTPGVTLYICETKVTNNISVPDLSRVIKYGRARKEYSSINTSLNGATATKFQFSVPVPIQTGSSYAVVIKFDGGDTGFSLWTNRSGETFNVVGTSNNPSVSKGALDGYFFTLTNGTVSTPQSEIDLKFKLNVARFSTSNTTYSIVNRNYEMLFVDLNSRAGGDNFIGGEQVFANTGYAAAQTINVSATSNTITGTNTSFLTTFAVNDYIVLNSGSNNDIRRITSISNNTSMSLDYTPRFTNASSNYLVAPIATVTDFKTDTSMITLVASTANTTFNFQPNTSSNTIVGIESGVSIGVRGVGSFPLNDFTPRFLYLTPTGTSVNTAVKLANSSVSTISTNYKVDNDKKKRFTDFNAVLYSRTEEIRYGNGSVGTLQNNKSLNFDLTFSTTNEFISPLVDEEDLLFNGYRKVINDDTTGEHTSTGSASSKHISKRVTLADGQDAEDMRVYVTAYRPFGTNVLVYVKFYNEADPESFESKNWTLLERITADTVYSSLENPKDLIEIEYRLPNFPLFFDDEEGTVSSGTLIDGKFTGANNSAVFASTSSTVNTDIVTSDLVRIYDPLFPNTSLITVVTASNTTSLTIDTTLDSANTRLLPFITNGLSVEKVEYKNTAYSNFTSNGVIRYYNSEMAAFDTYKSFAFKVVMTIDSPDVFVYPYVDDIRGIALSV